MSPSVVVMPVAVTAMLPLLAPIALAPTAIVVVVTLPAPDLAVPLARAPRRVDPPTSLDPIGSLDRHAGFDGRRWESRRGARGAGRYHAGETE